MKTLRALLVLAMVAGASRAGEKPAIAFRALDFPAAAAAATKEQKLVFIDFYTAWCAPCKALDTATWTDASVGRLVNARAVALKLDAEKAGRELAERYNVSAYPTLLLLKPDGTVVDRLIGFREPRVFLTEFQAALDGNPSFARMQAVIAKAAESAEITHELVEARYKRAQANAAAGNRDEALADFLWCYDVGMIAVKSYVGVRSSFLLGAIERLGTAESRAALIARRAVAEQRMLADAGDRDAAADFAALCATLKEEDRMVAAFDMLPPGDPRRSSMAHRLYHRLIELRRYPDALEVLPYASARAQFDRAQQMPAQAQPHIQEANHRYVVSIALDAIEVLAGADQPEYAREFQQELRKFDATPKTLDALKARLKRAKHPELLLPSAK